MVEPAVGVDADTSQVQAWAEFELVDEFYEAGADG